MLKALVAALAVSLCLTPGFRDREIARKGQTGESGVKSGMSQGLWGAVRKMAVNTASSAAGTGAVLGVHSAFAPPDGHPKVLDSQIYHPTFKSNKLFIDLEFGEGASYFTIAIGALSLALMGLCAASYCGCSPKAWQERKEREEFKQRMKELEIRTLEREEQAQETQDRLTIKRRYEDGSLDYSMASTSTPASTSNSGSTSNPGQEAGRELEREYNY